MPGTRLSALNTFKGITLVDPDLLKMLYDVGCVWGGEGGTYYPSKIVNGTWPSHPPPPWDLKVPPAAPWGSG